MPRYTECSPIVVLVSVLASVAALASCGESPSQEARTTPEPALGVVRPVVSGADIVLPLDTYYLSEEDDLLLQRVERTFISDCMRRFGVEYRTDPPYPSRSIGPRKRLFGLFDGVEAASAGYNVNVDQSIDRDREREARKHSPKMSEAALRILSGTEDPDGDGREVPVGGGVPDQGCGGEAHRKLTDGVPEADKVLDSSYLDGVSASLGARAEKDSRVQGVFGEWSDCMKRKGFDYATPISVVNDPAWSTDRPDEREKATAKADVACKRQTKLVDTWLAVTVAYQKQYMESHATELHAYTKAKQEQLAKAARLAAQR